MTDQEIKVLDVSADLWNEFLKLPSMHPDDQNEFRLNLHALQNIIYAREGLRSVPVVDKEIPDNWPKPNTAEI